MRSSSSALMIEVLLLHVLRGDEHPLGPDDALNGFHELVVVAMRLSSS